MPHPFAPLPNPLLVLLPGKLEKKDHPLLNRSQRKRPRAYQQRRGVSLPRAPSHPASDSRERLTLLSAAHDLHRKLWL